MPYIDGDNGPRWTSGRGRTLEIRDQLRRAAEWFAEQVETYLYDTNADVWMKPEFLSWAVAQYDDLKSGTGNYSQMNPAFDPNVAADEPLPQPAPGQKRNPRMDIDAVVHYPEHAKQAKHINTEKK